MTANGMKHRPTRGRDFYLARAQHYESAAEREPNPTIRAALETMARAYRVKVGEALGCVVLDGA
jgi:hypothetical protein